MDTWIGVIIGSVYACYMLVFLPVQMYKMTDWQIGSNKLHFIRNRIKKETPCSPNTRNTSVEILLFRNVIC
jgi:hypothetical protein